MCCANPFCSVQLAVCGPALYNEQWYNNGDGEAARVGQLSCCEGERHRVNVDLVLDRSLEGFTVGRTGKDQVTSVAEALASA